MTFTVGEVQNGDPAIVSFFAGGQTVEGIDTGLTAPFDYPLYYAVREGLVEKSSTKRVAETLAADHLYPHPETLVTIVGNHDVPRLAGMKGITPAQIKLVFGFTTVVRGIPQLYYGDEIGMAGGGDPENRQDFSRRLSRRSRQRLHPSRPHAAAARYFRLRATGAQAAPRSRGLSRWRAVGLEL